MKYDEISVYEVFFMFDKIVTGLQQVGGNKKTDASGLAKGGFVVSVLF